MVRGISIPTYDANGNISEYLSASDGSVAAHYDYSPFGEQLVASGPLASSFTHRFSTKPYCQTTGFCEYQMRKYNPNLGRWMSRDPIGEEGENNVYLFCINNINEYDFLGLDTKEISIPVNGRFEYINRGPAPGWTLSRQVYYYSEEWVSDEYIISVDYEKHCSEDGTPDITFGKIKGNLKGRLDHVGISVLIIGGGYEYDITWDSPYAPKREFHNNTKKVSITYKFSVVEKYYFGLSPGLFNISFDIGLELNFHSRVVATKEVVFTHSCSCVKQEAK